MIRHNALIIGLFVASGFTQAPSSVPEYPSSVPAQPAIDVVPVRYEPKPRTPMEWPVEVTAYCSVPKQTDDSPFVTASGKRVHAGTLAVSRDLLYDAPFGTAVWLCAGEQCRSYVVEDTMAARWQLTADVWMASCEDAVRFGRRKMVLRVREDI